MNFLACDYPWGSCPLYFRSKGYWSSPLFTTDLYNLNQKYSNLNQMCVRDRRILLKTRHNDQAENIEIIDGIETEKLQLFHEPDKRRRYRRKCKKS